MLELTGHGMRGRHHLNILPIATPISAPRYESTPPTAELSNRLFHALVVLGQEFVRDQREGATGIDHPTRARVRVRRADHQHVVQIAPGPVLELGQHALTQLLKNAHRVRAQEDDLVTWAESEERALDRMLRDGRVAVPRAPDRAAIDDLCVTLIERALTEGIR